MATAEGYRAGSGDWRRGRTADGSALAGKRVPGISNASAGWRGTWRADAYPFGVPPGLSPVHLLVIFVVALIVLGPEKGPEALGKGARLLGEAKQWVARAAEEMQGAVSLQSEEPTAPMAGAPTALRAVAGDAEPPNQPPAEETAAPGAQSVSRAAVAADVVTMSAQAGPGNADHPPVDEEAHL